MLKKIGPIELCKAVKALIENKTHIACYDVPPTNAPSPLYYVELAATKPDNTKTMYIDSFIIWIHAIAKASKSNVEIYKLIEELDDIMTCEIKLPESVNLIKQQSNGLQTLKEDETKEKHAVMAYEFKIAYGFKSKI